MMNTLKADVFVVPNGTATINNFFLNSQKRQLKEMFQANYGLELTDEEKFAQVWITNSDHDNMVDHHFKDGEKVRRFLGWLPVSFLKLYKEGMTRRFKCYDTENSEVVDVELTFNQSDYRYQRFGKFEDVVASLV